MPSTDQYEAELLGVARDGIRRVALWTWVVLRRRTPRGASPHRHTSPDGPVSSTRTGVAGTSRPRTRYPCARARTAMSATCRRRSVPGRRVPRASATSLPCAQVSMIRLVIADRSDIGGPYQGSRVDGSHARAAASNARAASCHHVNVAGPPSGTAAFAASTKPSRSVIASRSASNSAGRRDRAGERRVEPAEVGDLVAHGPGLGAGGQRPGRRREPAHQRHHRRALVVEVGQQVLDRRPAHASSPNRPATTSFMISVVPPPMLRIRASR